MTLQIVCQACNMVHRQDTRLWRCGCGGPLDVGFRGTIDMDMIGRRSPGMWRYREALPIGADARVVSFNEGFTPIVRMQIDGKPLTVKQENLFPTGSFKDRGASVLISRALELGVEKVVEDSSGNAGAAVAAYASRAGIECEIYVPESNSPGKLAQIRLYGAKLIRVPGSREATARAAMEAAEHHFYASHVWNPFFFQGTKTYAFEIWEQLGFKAPDTLIVPTGHGTMLIGAFLGFRDLLENGLIDRLPRMVAVQAANCAPLYRMWRDHPAELSAAPSGDTIAEGIAIAEPARAPQILDIIHETCGRIVTVTDAEIEVALLDICKQGLYAEPTSATAVAAFRKFPENSDECVVAPLTGHGLKSTEKMLKLTGD
ncbi:MAG: threonine synthase [Candidatus Latescibacteria bacterium]|nr:threonine synthase [Candidatus Latescibacterota bacterium]